jgi:oligosaccharyl transferase complex subunit OST4
MITDNELNSIAIFLGTLMMSLIVLYHFLAVNSGEKSTTGEKGTGAKGAIAAPVVSK